MAYYWIEFGSMEALKRKGRLPEVPTVAAVKISTRFFEDTKNKPNKALEIFKTLPKETKMGLLRKSTEYKELLPSKKVKELEDTKDDVSVLHSKVPMKKKKNSFCITEGIASGSKS
jgi:hypothetical protein